MGLFDDPIRSSSARQSPKDIARQQTPFNGRIETPSSRRDAKCRKYNNLPSISLLCGALILLLPFPLSVFPRHGIEH
jgi:hypothetical protein